MILSRFARNQLRVFAAATVIGVVVLGIVFLRIPESMGIGRYDVTATFSRGAGLYDGAQVNYRGTRVGKVTDMSMADDGITVALSLDSDVEIPAGVRAEIHSLSAVGEQYVDLVTPDDLPAMGRLGDGDNIPLSRTTTPVEIGRVLDNVARLVDSLPEEAMNNLLAETSTGLSGRTDDMQTILDGTRDFMDTAEANLAPTKRLIAESGPLMHSVNSSSDSLTRLTINLAQVTDVLREGDSDLRSLIEDGHPFAADTESFLHDLEPDLPVLLGQTSVITDMLARYNTNLAGILGVYPKLVAALQSITLPFADTDQVQLSLANLNSPSACTRGFLPQSLWRDPSDESPMRTPLVYCQEAPSDPRVVRGARNLPCIDYPGRRAATPALCRRGD